MSTAEQSLRDRCKAFLAEEQRNAIMRVGSPVDALMAFVLAETGRAADPALKETLPLVLYFGDDAERDEFVAIFREAKPNIITRKLP